MKKQKSNIKKESGNIEELKNQLARALADYDNLSKRVERERGELGKFASIGVILKLLPILDNLVAAQVHLKDQGLAINIGEFKKVLEGEGLTEIKPEVGSEFDHETMEAIEVVKGEEDNNASGTGKVAELVLVGWKYSDGSVIRHAKVKVSRSSS